MKSNTPTVDSLVSLFKRRGMVDHPILFWGSESGRRPHEFGLSLLAGEQAAISMSASESSQPCWLTTERFVWLDSGEQQQVRLDEVADVSPLVIDSDKQPPVLAMQIESSDKSLHDVRMPSSGILNGFIAVLHRFARRSW